MRKSKEKKLFGKLTEYAGKKITWMNQVEEWTMAEISEKCGIGGTRLSEIKSYAKYQRPINETFLAALIGGGILSITEIKEKCDLDNEEEAFVNKMSFYENSVLRKEAQAAELEGINVLELIKEARKNKK